MTDEVEVSGLVWRVFCEHCAWQVADLATRREAVTAGYIHTEAHHSEDEEWSFRVQGFRPRQP